MDGRCSGALCGDGGWSCVSMLLSLLGWLNGIDVLANAAPSRATVCDKDFMIDFS